jgi:hypothetical protein
MTLFVRLINMYVYFVFLVIAPCLGDTVHYTINGGRGIFNTTLNNSLVWTISVLRVN